MEKEITILFLSRLFYPHIGGVEKHVLEVGTRLAEKGYKVIVISESHSKSYSNNSNNYQLNSSSAKITGKLKNIESYNIEPGKDDWFKKFRIWKQLWKYRGLIKSADIVHCHDVFFWYLPFRFLYPTKKVYTTFHGYEGNSLPTKKAIFMHKIAEKLSAGNICVGDFLKKWYGTKPTFVTYGAVDNPKETHNRNYDKNLIVFLGRLEEETGIMEYLKAFKEVSKKYKELKLIILGDGSQREDAKEYVGKNKLNVEFKGFVTNINDYLQRAYFVFVSRYLGILESLVSKKFVLAIYNNEIKKDYLEMAPFADYISISADSNQLKDELNRYLADEKLKNSKINKGYEWAKDQTWENMVNLYLRLWSFE
jgi:glycosyltransferase involved in cell wall biosynthesis